MKLLLKQKQIQRERISGIKIIIILMVFKDLKKIKEYFLFQILKLIDRYQVISKYNLYL